MEIWSMEGRSYEWDKHQGGKVKTIYQTIGKDFDKIDVKICMNKKETRKEKRKKKKVNKGNQFRKINSKQQNSQYWNGIREQYFMETYKK